MVNNENQVSNSKSLETKEEKQFYHEITKEEIRVREGVLLLKANSTFAGASAKDALKSVIRNTIRLRLPKPTAEALRLSGIWYLLLILKKGGERLIKR